jgi:hypothetical protein
MTDYNQVAYELLYILKYDNPMTVPPKQSWTNDEDFDVRQIAALGHWLEAFAKGLDKT